MQTASPRSFADHPLTPWLLGTLGLALVMLGARPYAGSWNDGSRLAAVESLAERHTLAIDDSIFCKPAPESIAAGHPPYDPAQPALLIHGTLDKLRIDGHFYSDKPAVITGLMAGIYQTCKWLGLPSAADRPDLFCWMLTVVTAGLAYALSILALYWLGARVGLEGTGRLLWVASFALATFALTYTRHVNNHILQLSVLAVLCWQLVELAHESASGRDNALRLVGIGTLAGIGFNLDLGSGPLLVAGLAGLLLFRCRRKWMITAFVLAALPWIAAGVGINYAIGRVIKPMNMVPEYSAWPGCPFTPANLTGYARHDPLRLSMYAASMLVGKKGVLVHNLPLLLTLPALGVMLRRPSRYRPELLFALGWCGATWLLYAALSNNSSGGCCSIRWFVPFLAPGYFLLAVYLKACPDRRTDFAVLSAWGGVLAALMWWKGPWTLRMTPLLWPIVASAMLTWLIQRWRCKPARTEVTGGGTPEAMAA